MIGLQVFREMDHLQREMDQLFRDLGVKAPLNDKIQAGRFKVRDTGDAFSVSAPLPRLDTEKLDIKVLGRRLHLQGEILSEEVPEDARWHRRERQSGGFEQVITLSAAIDAEKVEAEYKNGLLSIHLPKAQEALPKKIAVKTA